MLPFIKKKNESITTESDIDVKEKSKYLKDIIKIMSGLNVSDKDIKERLRKENFSEDEIRLAYKQFDLELIEKESKEKEKDLIKIMKSLKDDTVVKRQLRDLGFSDIKIQESFRLMDSRFQMNKADEKQMKD